MLLSGKVILPCGVLYLIMSSRRQVTKADGTGDTAISRRSMLAAGGIVVFGGLSGCLNRVASTVTNTGASPAAVFAGRSGDGDATTLGDPRVSRLTPTVAAGSGALSGEVELEGWVTSSAVEAQDYNSSRSNKQKTQSSDEDSDGDGVDDVDADSDGDGVGDGTEGSRANYNNTRSNRSGIARPPDILDDELDEDDETFRVVSRLDTELLEATAAAWRSISKRSARTGRNPELDREVTAALEAMAETLSKMREGLVKCPNGVCKVALENVEDREEDIERAFLNAETGEWEAFGNSDGDQKIFAGDYLLPAPAFDPSGRYSPAERAETYRYFDGKMMVGERFTVCLPDAEVPGGNGSIREAVTPQRFIDYMTGRTGGEGRVYSWGDAGSDADGIEDCDDSDEDVRPGTVCGNTEHFFAAISGPVSTGGSLEVIREGEETVVVSDKTVSSGSERVCGVQWPFELELCGPGVWKRPSLPSSGSGVSVFQVMVQPPGCPHPFPALLYVQQCRNDDQLIYTGGWIVDDGALYEQATTVLTMTGSTEVVGIECCFDYDSDGDGFGEVVERSVPSERAMRGAQIGMGTVDELVQDGVISERTKKGYDYYKSQADTSARAQEGDRVGGVWATHLALDAPILHLTNAGSASNDVKFKAGAELSGQVN